MAAIRGEDAPTDRSKYPSEQLRLKVVEAAQQWASPVKAFFEAWSEAHASTSFQTTKRGLEKLSADSGRDAVAQRFLVEFEFRLESVSSCTDATYMAELLTSVDREMCRVDYIALVVQHAEFEPAGLVQLFQNVEWWRSRGADVLIELYLPGIHDYVTPFAQWKPLFGLVARRSDFAVIAPLAESPSGAEGTWSVKVVCSEHDTAGESMIDFLTDRSGTYYTTARLFMASLVPLVRGDVSHVSFCRPLEDDSERWDWCDEVWVRVRWLAFLFRLGKSKSWSLQDTPLRFDHATLFVDVFAATSVCGLMEVLWMDEWDSVDDDEFSRDDTAQLREEIEGVVNEALRFGESTVDKALSLSLSSAGDLDLASHLAGFVGAQLRELSLSDMTGSAATVSAILDTCPSVAKLSVSLINQHALT